MSTYCGTSSPGCYIGKKPLAGYLNQIWLEPNKKSARRAAAALIDDFGRRFLEAIRCLEDGLDDSLSFYDFPDIDKKRILSSVMQY